MSTAYCPHCHQPLPRKPRAGAPLTALKARIFDLVRLSSGIRTDEINAIVFNGKARRTTIRSHIWQINEALAESGVEIRCYNGFYSMREGKAKAIDRRRLRD
jgi:hypothetical protein